jgi:hypothetical protein
MFFAIRLIFFAIHLIFFAIRLMFFAIRLMFFAIHLMFFAIRLMFFAIRLMFFLFCIYYKRITYDFIVTLLGGKNIFLNNFFRYKKRCIYLHHTQSVSSAFQYLRNCTKSNCIVFVPSALSMLLRSEVAA